MKVGEIKIAEDSDFQHFRKIIDNHEEWDLSYSRDDTKVWTKSVPGIEFKMVKLATIFHDVSPNVMYDVLHDPEYRKVWDKNMIEAFDIGYLNPNNDIGYYSMSCPVPLKNRDFVLQRSWLDMGTEKIIMNHSVSHKDYVEKSSYVRGISYITGYIVRPAGDSGCFVGYASQTDPKGTLPSWMVNKVTTIFAPKVLKILLKASQGYPSWKTNNNPHFKPWFFPEQIAAPRITAEDCGVVRKIAPASPALLKSKVENIQPSLSQPPPNSKDEDSVSSDESLPFSCLPGIRFSLKYFTRSRRDKGKKQDASVIEVAGDKSGKQKKSKV